MARTDDDLLRLLRDLESDQVERKETLSTEDGKPGVTDYRNPLLAEAMAGLGYVQKFGAGLEITRATLKRNGNPEPEFTVDPAYIGAVVRSVR